MLGYQGWPAGELPYNCPPPGENDHWPRIMTAPHPKAVGSLGAEFVEWMRSGGFYGIHKKRVSGMRWWTRLVLERALEVDSEGRLVWRHVVLSSSRQLGKSYLARELCWWRLHQAARFGEVQTVIHTAANVSMANNVYESARLFASKSGYRTFNSGNDKRIVLEDLSQWTLQAANDGLGASHSVSFGFVDEAFDVPEHSVANGLEPTMLSAEQPQLWLVSTAGVSRVGETSTLMPSWRSRGFAELDDPVKTLFVEWSAPEDTAGVGDERAWRAASGWWDWDRAEQVAEKARFAKTQRQVDAFRLQYLNIWPPVAEGGSGWLAGVGFERCRSVGLFPPASVDVVCAVEDTPDGAGGFAAAAWVDAGQVCVTVFEFPRLSDAWAWVAARHPVAVLCGRSLVRSAPAVDSGAVPCGVAETAAALPELRRLLESEHVVWDGDPFAVAPELDVRPAEGRSGLAVMTSTSVRSGGVRCGAWAVDAAWRRDQSPGFVAV